jgi:ketosteroid isomerase-like protein
VPSLAEAVELFERRRRAWLAEDSDAYLALWADDMTFRSPVHEEPLRGKQSYAELVRRSIAMVRPVAFVVDHIAVEGELVLAEWHAEIEWRADGRRSSWRGMSVCEIRDGLIGTWREYWNPADFGAIPTETD